MTEALLENFMQLQRKIVDPQDVFDQANGCRGMLLVIEALFRQGKLSQEARDYLNIQYTTLLNTLWMEDLGKEHDKLQTQSPSSAGSHPSSNPFPNLKPFSLKNSPIITEEAIRHTLDFAVSLRRSPSAHGSTASSSVHQGPQDDRNSWTSDGRSGVQVPNPGAVTKTSTAGSKRKGPQSASNPRSNVAASSSATSGGRSGIQEPTVGNTMAQLPQQHRAGATAAPGSTFCTAKSVYAAANPERYKNDIADHPDLRGIGDDILQRVLNEMMTEIPDTTWDGVAGLQYAKNAVREMIVWPLLRPDIFTGAREPPRGMLLFGPPGTGKTLIGRCIAAEAKATFFCVSASTLVSKWVGESNLLVRGLFAVARVKQPSVIFLDELDSLLSARQTQDQKHDRQLTTELFVQLDGAKTYKDNRVIFIGATNRPFDLDDAARRRLVKRLYIALPDRKARVTIIKNLFKDTKHSITEDQLEDLAVKTKGYSGADMANLCKEAALAPIRDVSGRLDDLKVDEIRAVSAEDMKAALRIVKASVAEGDLKAYADWNEKFGCCSKPDDE